METIRKNFDVALAKGEFGESIVRSYLERRGFIVYSPKTNGAHAFDIMAIKDKERCIAIDVKAKARRNKYPDTGINDAHYRIYKEFSLRHNMPFWLFFVDELLLKIYGNHLDELDKPRIVCGQSYPLEWRSTNNKITRYWPLEAMRVLHQITPEESIKLQSLSQRSHPYATNQ